jgi:hypothetical protein
MSLLTEYFVLEYPYGLEYLVQHLTAAYQLMHIDYEAEACSDLVLQML